MKFKGVVRFIIIIAATLFAYVGVAFFQSIIAEPVMTKKISEQVVSRPSSLGLNFNTRITAFVLPPNAKVATYVFTGEKITNDQIKESPLISQEVRDVIKGDLFVDRQVDHWIEDRGGAQIGIYKGYGEKIKELISGESNFLDFQIVIIDDGDARELIDLGADLVVRKSPGFFKDSEVYNNSLILNSLGYFWPSSQKNNSEAYARGAIAKISFITGYGIDYSLIPINSLDGVIRVGY